MKKKDQEAIAVLYTETNTNNYGFNSPEDMIDFEDEDWREKESHGFFAGAPKLSEINRSEIRIGGRYIHGNGVGGQGLYQVISIAPDKILMRMVSLKGKADEFERTYMIMGRNYVDRVKDPVEAINHFLKGL